MPPQRRSVEAHGPSGEVIVTPEGIAIGTVTRTVDAAHSGSERILFTHTLDFGVVNSVIGSDGIGAVVVTGGEFADHARKMLQEAGIALVVDDASLAPDDARCLVSDEGVIVLDEGVPVTAICSVMSGRNLEAYRRFGVTELGYFRFKFQLFQLFSTEPSAYDDPARIERHLYDELAKLGEQHWTDIRCVLSDPTSAELAEIGIQVEAEVNPDLGLRGPRVMERWLPELAAVRRFLAEFETPVQICAPFVASAQEYREFVALVARAGIDRSQVRLGFTLEVPAVAEDLDSLLGSGAVDFMAIGTSDLFALFNGVDRSNRRLKVVHDSPANLSLLRRVVAQARRHGVHTFVCGEIRRDTKIMTELVRAGVGELICSARVKELSFATRLSAAAGVPASDDDVPVASGA
jgi:hypothetical protein